MQLLTASLAAELPLLYLLLRARQPRSQTTLLPCSLHLPALGPVLQVLQGLHPCEHDAGTSGEWAPRAATLPRPPTSLLLEHPHPATMARSHRWISALRAGSGSKQQACRRHHTRPRSLRASSLRSGSLPCDVFAVFSARCVTLIWIHGSTTGAQHIDVPFTVPGITTLPVRHLTAIFKNTLILEHSYFTSDEQHITDFSMPHNHFRKPFRDSACADTLFV